jgi:hypothetical protein
MHISASLVNDGAALHYQIERYIFFEMILEIFVFLDINYEMSVFGLMFTSQGGIGIHIA